MGKKALVSLITPCHNSSAFIHRLLDSVLEQTYPCVEMLCIDNDSKDNTKEIIESYMDRFRDKGYFLYYYHEEDLGPSAAINYGLKLIQGDYLMMPDSDDWFADSNCLAIQVDKFENLPDEYAVVRCQQQQILDVSFSKLDVLLKNASVDDPGCLFDDCLFSSNEYSYVNIGSLIKVKALRQVTGMNIYAAYNTGQGRQIFMPLYHKYKCYTIPKPMVNYLVRSTSISHCDYSKYGIIKDLYSKEETYFEGIFANVRELDIAKKQEYKREYLKDRALEMAVFAWDTNHKEDIKYYLQAYKINGGNIYTTGIKIIIRKCVQFLYHRLVGCLRQ